MKLTDANPEPEPEAVTLITWAARLWAAHGFTPDEVRSWGHPEVAAAMEAQAAGQVLR